MGEPAEAGDSRIDDCLSVRDGHLWIEGCDAVELAARFGTPVYVVSENQLRRNARRLVKAFSARWPGPVRVLPSIKANHVLALRRVLTEEGLGCDTFGPMELQAALACGVPPELISVNGTGKSAELVEQAVSAGCRLTLDSPRELDLAIQAAAGSAALPRSGCGYGPACRTWRRSRPTSAPRASRSPKPPAGTRPESP